MKNILGMMGQLKEMQQKMQELQPEVKAIQDRYAKLKATDPARQKMNTELMNLYRERKVNPASGCIPILLTMPVLFAFYTLLSQEGVSARAGDDASRTALHRMDDLPPLAFDHDKIIEKAKARLSFDLYTTPIAKPFLSRTFTPKEAGKLFRILHSNAPRSGTGVIERLSAFGLVKETSNGDWKFVR